MAENSNIVWCDHTFNPWEGCTKIGPGCDHCYAEVRDQRFSKGVHWGPGAPRRRTSKANWCKLFKWDREAFMQCGECGWRGVPIEDASRAGMPGTANHVCGGCGSLRLLTQCRPRVFCSSLADVFDNEVDPDWRADLWELISSTPNLTWILLTKRIGNVLGMIPEKQWPFQNVWLGATVVNQEEADRDIPKLLKIPAAVHFLSMEPLLGAVDIRQFVSTRLRSGLPNNIKNSQRSEAKLSWCIIGGESGTHARPMNPDWVRSLRDQCKAAGVAFFMKQLGGHPNKRDKLEDLPAKLRIREFPNSHIWSMEVHRRTRAIACA